MRKDYLLSDGELLKGRSTNDSREVLNDSMLRAMQRVHEEKGRLQGSLIDKIFLSLSVNPLQEGLTGESFAVDVSKSFPPFASGGVSLSVTALIEDALGKVKSRLEATKVASKDVNNLNKKTYDTYVSLVDTPNGFLSGSFLRVNIAEDAVEHTSILSHENKFTSLRDSPLSYAGAGSKFVATKSSLDSEVLFQSIPQLSPLGTIQVNSASMLNDVDLAENIILVDTSSAFTIKLQLSDPGILGRFVSVGNASQDVTLEHSDALMSTEGSLTIGTLRKNLTVVFSQINSKIYKVGEGV